MAVPTVPAWVRVAVGLAILGVGISLAFIFMPGSTTTVRVVAGIACVACLVFVAFVWRQIGRNQRSDAAIKDWRTDPYGTMTNEAEYLLKGLREDRKMILGRREARRQVKRDGEVLREAGF